MSDHSITECADPCCPTCVGPDPTPTAEEVVNQTSPICEHASAQDDDSPCGVCVIAALRQAGFYIGRCNHVTTDEGTGYCPQVEALARRAEKAEARYTELLEAVQPFDFCGLL